MKNQPYFEAFFLKQDKIVSTFKDAILGKQTTTNWRGSTLAANQGRRVNKALLKIFKNYKLIYLILLIVTLNVQINGAQDWSTLSRERPGWDGYRKKVLKTKKSISFMTCTNDQM